MKKRLLPLVLCLSLLLSAFVTVTACGETEENVPAGTDATAADVSEGDVTQADPFAGIDYKGRAFRINTSINVASPGMGNSNALIQGNPDAGASLVNDAVVERNAIAEARINVKLEYTQMDEGYGEVFAEVRKLAAAGTDDYDLVINDLFPFANLLIEGNFRNILDADCTGFRFDEPCWYEDYMDDLRLRDGYRYLLAGDYFIDIIRSAHILLFNKGMYSEHTHTDAREVYDWVRNYEWTFEKLNEMITGYYQDKNNDGQKNRGDVFGLSLFQDWGSSIPFVVSAAPGFVQREENGTPVAVLDQSPRASDLVDRMTEIACNDSCCMGLTTDEDILKDFTEGMSLICDYQRLGSLENPVLRDMQGEAGVLPYPMLYASDKQYVTSAHDTTEVGAILSTNRDLSFTSTVIQVLNLQTAETLMPKYYGEALQIQYVSDPDCSEMIRIIHDNFRDSFILAYNEATGGAMMHVFYKAVAARRTFAVTYKSDARVVTRKLKTVLESYASHNDVE